MRCPTRGEPRHVLTQVSVVLLWLLHIVTSQHHPRLTSLSSSASGAGSVTVDPTPVTIGISATTPPAAEWSVGSGGGGLAGDGGQWSAASLPPTGPTSRRDAQVDGAVTQVGSDTHVSLPPTEVHLFPSEGATVLPTFKSSSPTSSLPELIPTSPTTQWPVPSVSSSTPSSSSSSLTFTTASEIIYNSQSSSTTPHGSSSSSDDDSTTLSSLDITSVADVPPPSVTTTLLRRGAELEGTRITTPSLIGEPNSTTSQTNTTMGVSHTNSSDTVPTPSLALNTTHHIVHVDVTVPGGEGRNVTFSDVVTPGGEMWNQTSVLPPGEDGEDEGLSVGATVGISVACVLVIVSGVLVGLAVLYHRHRSRKLDTTKAQTNHYTGLWDDNVTLSYINNHFDFFQKDAQDEMISLDNDAYLNSLEFMVFTNTWGDGKRNTRF